MNRRKAIWRAFAVAVFAVSLCGIAMWNHRLGIMEEDVEEFEWFCSVSHWDPPEWSLEEDTVTGQISRETGVSFTYHIPQKNTDMQLGQMLVKGRLPDVISIMDSGQQKQLVESGKVWDIRELLEKYDSDSPLLEQFPQDVEKILEEAEGGWYNYPSHINSPDMRKLYPPCDDYYWDLLYYQSNEGIMFNRAIMERLGLKVEDLQTEEQALEALRRVKKSGGENGEEWIPLLLNGEKYEQSSMSALSKSFGVKWTDAEGRYRDYYLAPQAKQAMKFLNAAYREGCLDPGQLSYDVEKMQQLLQSGRVFCFIGNLADAGVDEREWEGGIILSSLGDAPTVLSSCQAQVWLHTYISKSCKNPQKIAKWLSFMAGEKGLMLNYFGIEGRDYVRKDGLPERTREGMEGENSPENGFWIFWPFANTTWEKHIERPPKEDSRQAAAYRVQTAMGRYKGAGLYENALVAGLSNDLEEKSDYGDLVNEVKEYRRNRLVPVITADSPEQFEEEYGNFIQGLTDLGLPRLDGALNECYQKRCERFGITLADDYQKIRQK